MMRKPVNLRAANLNLVPVLRALLREASVTRAARSLSLSPSATSGALAELRVLLDDALLVRMGPTMRLTPKAQQMVGRLEDACNALERLLLDQAFDPKTAERTFTVSALDYIGVLVGGRLLDVLSRDAPGVRVRFIEVPADLEKRLSTGGVDLGMVAMNQLSWPGVSASPICPDRRVGLVDRAHPLAARPRPSDRDLAQYPRVHWEPGPELSARAIRTLGSARQPPDFNLALQSITGAATTVVGSRAVAFVPNTLARRMMEILPVVAFDLPSERYAIETAVIWSAVVEGDPAHSWFRGVVYDALRHVHEAVER